MPSKFEYEGTARLNEPTPLELHPLSTPKPTIIGLYGISGCGKTSLLRELETSLGGQDFDFYEGSEMINKIVPGGLEKFQQMTEQQKIHWREIVIKKIKQQCIDSEKIAIVTGHFLLWDKEDQKAELACTKSDIDMFTHIIYLKASAETLATRRKEDKRKSRVLFSANDLNAWQSAEEHEFRHICRLHGVLFTVVSVESEIPTKTTKKLIRDFQVHNEKYNLKKAEERLHEILGPRQNSLKTMLVLDADQTLGPQDATEEFWREYNCSRSLADDDNPLPAIFRSSLGLSYKAFRQTTMLYESACDDEEFENLCQKAAENVHIRDEFIQLLKASEKPKRQHVGAVVLTAGIRRIWEIVLQKRGLSNVHVIGGGRVTDGYVVTPEVKASLTRCMKNTYRLFTTAFGDSRVDLPMLYEADKAIVVVGELKTRKVSMEVVLSDAVVNHGLEASQVVFPSTVSPLEIAKLEQVSTLDDDFRQNFVFRKDDLPLAEIRFEHFTEVSASKLLATRMRDAAYSGPDLREAHHRAGFYLATHLLTDKVGLEGCPIRHVQNRGETGFKLSNEENTLIVAMMRAGEPMALGVSEAFPLASFLHAKHAHDIESMHVQKMSTIILVDAVINEGNTMAPFVEHLSTMKKHLAANFRIVVVTGVVQKQLVEGDNLTRKFGRDAKFDLFALRVSETKFKGKGKTDTGHRLFNTTFLD
ncbi:MAG: hypothetical protein Q9227_009164 [Pyrenula ochraceoflavens]